MHAKSKAEDRPTDGWMIGVEFDESSLLNREPDSPARVAGESVTRVRKMVDRKKRSFTRGIRVSIHISFFSLIPLS